MEGDGGGGRVGMIDTDLRNLGRHCTSRQWWRSMVAVYGDTHAQGGLIDVYVACPRGGQHEHLEDMIRAKVKVGVDDIRT